MKAPEEMTYKEMEQEIIANRCEMQKAVLTRKRELIRRNHELMVEIGLQVDIARKKRGRRCKMKRGPGHGLFFVVSLVFWGVAG